MQHQPFIRTKTRVKKEEKDLWEVLWCCVTSGCHPWQWPFHCFLTYCQLIHWLVTSSDLFPPTITPSYPRPRDQPCWGETCWLMCVTHASGNLRHLNCFYFRNNKCKGATLGEGGGLLLLFCFFFFFWICILTNHHVWWSPLWRFSPAVFGVAMETMLQLHS